MATEPNPRATAAMGTTLTGTRWRHKASGAEGQVLSTMTEMQSDWRAPRKTVTIGATIDPRREGTPFQIHARKDLIRCCELQGSTDGYVGGPCPVHGGPTWIDMPVTADTLVLTVEQLVEDWEPIGPRPPARRGPMPRAELATARAELRYALLKADATQLAALQHLVFKLRSLTSYTSASDDRREEAERLVQGVIQAVFPL